MARYSRFEKMFIFFRIYASLVVACLNKSYMRFISAVYYTSFDLISKSLLTDSNVNDFFIRKPCDLLSKIFQALS